MTKGAVGPYLLFPQLLEDVDLLKNFGEDSSDPNGRHVGIVRVATSIEESAVSLLIVLRDLNTESHYHTLTLTILFNFVMKAKLEKVGGRTPSLVLFSAPHIKFP